MDGNPHKRPLLVTLLGVLYLLVGLILLVAAIGIFIGGESALVEMGYGDVSGAVGVVAGVFAFMGVVYLVIFAGFMRGWSIMWYLGVIFSVLGLLISAASVVAGGMGSIVLVLINLLMLLYLFKKNVKRFFLDH